MGPGGEAADAKPPPKGGAGAPGEFSQRPGTPAPTPSLPGSQQRGQAGLKQALMVVGRVTPAGPWGHAGQGLGPTPAGRAGAQGAGSLPHIISSPPTLQCSIFSVNQPSGVMGAGGRQWCQTEPQVANQLIRFALNGQNPSCCWRGWWGERAGSSWPILPEPPAHFQWDPGHPG